MLKIYIKSIGLILLSIILYGFICPYLISMDSDFLVILGFGLIIISIPFLLWIVYLIIKDVPNIKQILINFKENFVK